LAIRVALGARAFQITREAILESMLVAIVAALLGWQIAGWAITSLVALPSGAIPRLYEVRLDGLMLAFTVGVALFSALAVGLVVAFRVLRATPWVWLRQHAGDLAGGVPVFNRGRPSSALIVASITAAVILLTGAALLLNSFVRLVSIDTGFDAENLLSFEIALPASRYSDDVRQLQFLQQLEASLRDLPGSDAVTVAASHPFQIPAIGSPLTIPGQGESNEMAAYRTVGPGYFRTLGIPILRGREFSPDDREGQPRVMVVNEAFARRYFGNGDAVGRTLQFRTKDVLTIIGVVGDTKATRLDSNPMVELYYPYLQPPRSGGFLRAVGLIRTGTALEHLMPAVRKTLQTIDPSLAIFNAAPMEQIVAESFALSTLYTITAISFGIVALILAVVGIYGLLAYSVSSRTHELGVQIALGADSGRLIWEVLRDGLVLTSAGVIAGLAGAFVLTRFLQRLLFGIEPQDPATFVVVALLFVAVALLASYVPARRATRIDPIVALRTE
jgi:putative ABC transport system permease protein